MTSGHWIELYSHVALFGEINCNFYGEKFS